MNWVSKTVLAIYYYMLFFAVKPRHRKCWTLHETARDKDIFHFFPARFLVEVTLSTQHHNLHDFGSIWGSVSNFPQHLTKA